MLYRHGLVTRMTAPGPAGSGAVIRSAIDRRDDWPGQGETPPGAQPIVESIAAAMARGCQAPPVAVLANDQTVSPTSGRARTDARCGDSVVVGARTSTP